MLVNEARWFGERIPELGSEPFPMLNVGSHTSYFRKYEQPWIDRYVFAPLSSRGCPVVHSDIRYCDGVDLVGDLTDLDFVNRVAAMNFGSIMSTNLLEHVPNRTAIAANLVAVVRPGGYLFVSCPYRFPFHPDPIDNMFRPTVEELASLFPGTNLVCGCSLTCGSLATYLMARAIRAPGAFAATLVRRLAQVICQTSKGISLLQSVHWLWRCFVQSCVIMQKPFRLGGV